MDTLGKIITCRAAIAWETNSPLSIEEVQVEPPKIREVRIKMISTGICGTDDHVLKGLLSIKFPLIPGHEGAGIVESIGEGVSSVKPGDKVLTLIVPQCRECSSCLHFKGCFCEKQDVLPSSGLMMDGTSRFTCKGKKIYHSFRTSTFTEYTVVPEIAVAKIDAAAPLDKVCLISCALPTGYGAAVQTAKVTAGSTCVVFGLGGIGSAVVMGCKASGALRIIGVDINEEKFPQARALGVTDCLNPQTLKKPVQQVIREMTGVGVDFAFEAIGLPDTMIAAWDSCHLSYGVCLIIGLAPINSQLPLEAEPIVSGRTLQGVCLGGYKTRDCIPQLVTDYLQNKINIDPLATYQLPFDQIHKAFELYHAGKVICGIDLHITRRKNIIPSLVMLGHEDLDLWRVLSRYNPSDTKLVTRQDMVLVKLILFPNSLPDISPKPPKDSQTHHILTKLFKYSHPQDIKNRQPNIQNL